MPSTDWRMDGMISQPDARPAAPQPMRRAPRGGPQVTIPALLLGTSIGLAIAAFLVMVVAGCRPPASTSAQATVLVTSFSPQGSSETADEPIRIRFSRPVVSEQQVGRRMASAPVVIQPALAVAAQWTDRQTLVLEPTQSPRPSTRYLVDLGQRVAGLSGETRFSFVHRPLEVERVSGVDLTQAPTVPRLTFHFNQPVEAGQVLARCLVRDPATQATTRLSAGDKEGPGEGESPPAGGEKETAGGEAASTLQVTVAAELGKARDYELRCEGLLGAGGNQPLARPYSLPLRTHDLFKVVAHEPTGRDIGADEAKLRIVFSTPVRLEDVRRALRIHPFVRAARQGALDRAGTTYTAEVNLEAGSEYAVALGKELSDVFGQALPAPLRFTFKTGDADPRMSFETGIYAVEAQGGGYPLWTRNVSKFEVECGRVPKARVPQLLTTEMDYDPWYSNSSDQKIDWGKLHLRKRTAKLSIKQAKNKWHLSSLELARLCGGGPSRGLFLAELRSDEVGCAAGGGNCRTRPRVLANVTDLGVLLKAGPASGLVWVTAISDGKPVAGAAVTVFTPQGKRVFAGSSNADGLVELPGTTRLLGLKTSKDDPEETSGSSGEDGEDEDEGEGDWQREQRLIVVVEKGDDMAVVDGNWQNGIQIWNFGIKPDRKAGLSRVRGFLQSDRGIYRPGETVHIKGLVREVGVGEAPRLPRQRRVEVTVEDGRGETVFERTLRLSPFGGFSFDLPLSEEANLGDYDVVATLGGQAFRERFQVEEFRKQTFELDLGGSQRHTRLGARLGFQLDARYLFGAPVRGGKVEWSVLRRRYYPQFPAFRQYAFADYAASGQEFWWGGLGETSEHDLEQVSDGEGETDQAGRFRFGFRDPGKLKQPHDYLAKVTVTDETDQSVSKQVAVTAHRSDFYLGLHPQEFVQAVDMPFAVNALAVAPDGSRVATAATLRFIRERSECSYAGGYRAVESCKTVYQKVVERGFQIAATGVATERIVPKEPGDYVVRIEAKDSRGNLVAASSHIWVIGRGEAFWSGDESARMSVVASKASYLPGETARLVPKANLAGATALVTLERNGILEARLTSLGSSGDGIEVPIRDQHAPNVYASVVLVRGRTGAGDRQRPRFKMGMVDLKVSAEKQRLKIEIETSKPSYEPRQQVSGKLRVLCDGKPVRAEVALSVADEGVLQVIGYKTPDPMATFYKPWGLGIDTATTWNRIARLNDPAEKDDEEGGDGAGPSDSGLRSRFLSSAFWAPSLVTGENGEVAFTFQAPDNLTAFRLMAVAADAGSRFGSGERRITVSKPLLVSPVLPRFLTAGDQATVGVVIHNYTGAAGTATVRASAKNVRLQQAEQSVALAKDGSARVGFPVEVGFVSQASFRFDVRLGDFSDAMLVTLPVARGLVVEKKTVARGQLAGELHGGEGEGKSEVKVPLSWPKEVVVSDSRLEVMVDRTGMAELGPGLRYLIEYPYGCLEQTLSRFIPLTKVQDLAASLDLPALRGPRLRRFVEAGAAKVVRHQHGNGHFSLWPSGETHPELTAYALFGLGEARRAGVKVDKLAMEKGRKALLEWANDSARKVLSGGDGATLAMAAYVLAELGSPSAGLNARLFEARAGLPLYGQAFLLRALGQAAAPAEQVERLRSELAAAMVQQGSTAVVRERDRSLARYMSSDTRSSALVLSALLQVEPQNPMVQGLAEGLLQQRQPEGRWSNTQENLYALIALADYARSRAAGSTVVALSLDGRDLLTGPGGGRRQAGRRTLSGGQVLAVSRSLGDLRPGALLLRSSDAARYAVRLVLARREEARQAVERGFAVEREYLDGSSFQPVERVAVGQIVKVRLQVRSPLPRHFLALEDPLPAGLEPINPKLASRDEQERSPHGTQVADSRAWTHTELHDAKVLAFADFAASGTHRLEYLARATIPGKFNVGPARVEAMYEPDISGRTAAVRFEVTREPPSKVAAR